ncbi:MAG: CHASE domain-containing protein, partial [Deltaproteobacteria bacterium]|nr:CHASE domain-containing protein [Deltaproteobacteria bacterium]
MISLFKKFLDRSFLLYVVYIACIAAAYYGAGRLSMLLAIPPGYTAPVWPSAGIALVGILLFGYRVWPGVLIGSFLHGLGIEFAGNEAYSALSRVLLSGTIGMGTTVQALAGAYLVRRFAGFPNPLGNAREVILFLLLAGPVACLISATWSVASLLLAGVIEFANASNNWLAWWVGDAMGVVCVTPILLVWLAQPREQWRSRRKQVTVPIFTALIILVSFLIYTNDRENHRIKTEFERSADNTTQILQFKINTYLETLQSLSGFYAASGPFTRNEFEVYAAGLMDRFSGIQRLSWNPVITAGERRQYEEAARREGYTDFEIRELDPQGRLVRAKPRAEYAPVYFVAPYNDNKFAVGFDLAANPLFAEGLHRARDEGRAGATPAIKLLGETEDQWGVVAVLPVYRPGLPHDTVEARRRNISGYVGGAFRLPNLMAASVALVREPGVQIEIWDEDKNTKLIQRYPANELEQQARNPTAIRKTGTLTVADRQWRLVCYPTAEFFALQSSWQVWNVLLGGLLFTGMLGAFLLVVSGHTAATERLVEERTAELEKANKERADFTAMIVHDLRSPLTVISGVSDTIKHGALGPLTDEQRLWIGRIGDNTKHMTDIISDFLDVSKLEAGRIELTKKPVDLCRLTTTCLDHVLPLAEKKNISLKHEDAQEASMVSGDARWLEQLFWNLLSNAIKFTPEGGHITVGCDRANGNITTWVKDTGVGIPPEELSRIFEKYHQTESRKTTNEKGTGLGLVICKIIVEAHRGKIWVSSEEGKGSTFYFSLPVADG